MTQPSNPGGLGADEQQAERWLSTLRNGSPAARAVARRGLAALFEGRGMVAEAIDMLVANAREGYRDVDLFQALSRLYRAQGQEYLAASAALEATRLSSGRRPAARPVPGAGRAPDDLGSQPPWRRVDAEPPSTAGLSPTAGAQSRPADAGAHEPTPANVRPVPPSSSWRRPALIGGWLAVVGTLFAAATVAATNAVSGALYLISAAALGLLLLGRLAPRRLLRLPDGPLGDGALLFAWLLLVLVAGASLPRGPGSLGDVAPAYQTPTPGLYRTPVATPSPPPPIGP